MPGDNLNQLIKQSIGAALSQDWNKASTLNQRILKISPNNIDTLNRLAKAKLELKNYREAKTVLKKVFLLDKFNSIAKVNMEKVNRPKNSFPKTTRSDKSQTVSFIEEPGKTKTVVLVNLGERQVMDCLQSGEEVVLHPLKRRIKVLTLDKRYLGSLPEDISLTLAHYIKMGSKFQSFIKNCNHKQVNIFIKETKKSARLKGLPAFSINKDNNSITLKHHSPMNSPLEIYDPETETGE